MDPQYGSDLAVLANLQSPAGDKFYAWAGVASDDGSCPPPKPYVNGVIGMYYNGTATTYKYSATGIQALPSWPVYNTFLAVHCVQPSSGSQCLFNIGAQMFQSQ
jgi:hypothetical protein